MKKGKTNSIFHILLVLMAFAGPVSGQSSEGKHEIKSIDGILIVDDEATRMATDQLEVFEDPFTPSVEIFLGISKQNPNFTTRLSGDVVGNGRIWEDPTNSDDPLFITPNEIRDRNRGFDEFLDFMGIDPDQARSGDVVGNGGGIYESQAYFYYHNLAKHIVSTFDQTFVEFSEREKKALREILNLMPLFGEQGKLVFLSNEAYPGFFFDENVDPAPRLAKTGFDYTYPIFFNRDLVYASFDKNSGTWISVLIHELGHQAGIENHLFLEELGAKVALIAQTDKEQLKYHFNEENVLEMMIYNHSFVNGMADVNITFREESTTLRGLNADEIRVVCGNLSFGGVQYQNLHWASRPEVSRDGSHVEVRAVAWAKVKCHDKNTGVFYDRSRDVTFEVDIYTKEVKADLKLK